MSNLQRILIVGDAGRGKTTLAQRLSEKLNIPKYSTDDYFYEVKFSKPRDKQEAIRTISMLYHNECWIVEGTTQWLWQPGLESADIILHLTYGSIFAQWYALIKRRFARKNAETLGELFRLLKHVFYKRYGIGYRKGKIPHEQIIAPYKEKVTVLTSFKDIDAFLESLN
jgi:adenylate kinase family enzyme